MNNDNKLLMNKLIETHGGSIKRINKRVFWETPKGEHYHVTTVFLRRMAKIPPTLVKEEHEIKTEVKEVPLDGGTKPTVEARTEEIQEISKETSEEGTSVKETKTKKTSRKKKTISKVEDEEKQDKKIDETIEPTEQ